MVELLPYADLFSVLQILVVFLVGTILFFTLKAYRITNYSFLIAFFIGFVLLEISFTFVLLNRLFGQTGILYHGTLWVHEIIQVGAFCLYRVNVLFQKQELDHQIHSSYGSSFCGCPILSVLFLSLFSI